jgi:predicted transcriptional regulator
LRRYLRSGLGPAHLLFGPEAFCADARERVPAFLSVCFFATVSAVSVRRLVCYYVYISTSMHRLSAMTDSTTLTVRLDRSVKKRLAVVAARTRRSKSFLAAEAIEEYLAIQEWQIKAIQKGIEAADRGKTVSHERVKGWARSLGSRRELSVPKAK